MSHLRRIIHRQVVSVATIMLWLQLATYAGACATFVIALRSVARLATTPYEVFLGVLTSSAVFILLVILGTILPMSQGKTTDQPAKL